MSAEQPPVDERIAAWVDRLAVGDLDQRRRALDELVRCGRPAVPALIAAVRGGAAKGRKWAVNALRKIGAEAVDSVPALVEALEGGDPKLAKAATRALRAIGEDAEAAVGSLIAALEAPEERHWALLALVAIQPRVPLAASHVVEGLAHRRFEVRKWAESRLHATAPAEREALRAALLGALADPRGSLRRQAATWLLRLGGAPVDARRTLEEALGSEARSDVRALLQELLRPEEPPAGP